MKTVSGVQLAQLEEPIRTALKEYSDRTDGRVAFEIDRAGKLELTPEKPNSARSATTYRHLGDVAGDFYVIAFKPQDGTGDDKTYSLDYLDTGQYPNDPKVIPRSKAGTFSEAHLTIAAHPIESAAEPIMFAGNFDLLGFDDGRSLDLKKIAELGQENSEFNQILRGEKPAFPTATLTVGYRGALEEFQTFERFGDPHAVYSPHPEVVQVCGFLAVRDSDSLVNKHFEILRLLQSSEPVELSQ